jgi:hypothetical protein
MYLKTKRVHTEHGVELQEQPIQNLKVKPPRAYKGKMLAVAFLQASAVGPC